MNILRSQTEIKPKDLCSFFFVVEWNIIFFYYLQKKAFYYTSVHIDRFFLLFRSF